MNEPRQIHFEWDEAKALSNVHKHGVAFLSAMTIFRDPRIVTMFDQDHSGSEERWISTGIAQMACCWWSCTDGLKWTPPM